MSIEARLERGEACGKCGVYTQSPWAIVHWKEEWGPHGRFLCHECRRR